MTGSLTVDPEAVAELCRRFQVQRLSVFGSALTADFDPATSDVDFLVEFIDGAEGLFDAYFGLKEELERLLGRPVDLVMPKALANPYFAESVNRTRRDLYAARREIASVGRAQGGEADRRLHRGTDVGGLPGRCDAALGGGTPVRDRR